MINRVVPMHRYSRALTAALIVGLSVLMMAGATLAGVPFPTGTPSATATPSPTITPSPIPRICELGGSSVSLSSRLVELNLPLSGSQVWRISGSPNQVIRELLIPPGSSHFNCTSTLFSGITLKACARLDPDTPAVGTIDCVGGVLTGYDSLLQIDHNTNEATVGGKPNSGLAFDPGCTNTFLDPSGTPLSSCLEGTDPDCTGAAHQHTGVCNSPIEQTFSGVSPAGGFKLHAAIDASIEFNADCSTPCPTDNTPLQEGEFQIAGDLTSGHTKSILWNVNDGALIFGTTGAGNGADFCGQAAGGPACLTEAMGHGFPNCFANAPSSLNNAGMVITYPIIDFDPTIGDFVATLQLQCMHTPTPTPPLTQTPSSTPTQTPLGGCAMTPQMGCQAPQRGSGISLNATAHRVGWRWLGGSTAVALTQFGDPVNGATDYHLCVYDTNAGSPSLVFGATVPAGGTCGTRPCWKLVRNRFSYANSAAAPDGVRTMTLQASGRTGASIAVHGRGTNLRLPISADGMSLLRESPEVTVQVQRGDGPNCWQAVFTSPALRNRRGVFVDNLH